MRTLEKICLLMGGEALPDEAVDTDAQDTAGRIRLDSDDVSAQQAVEALLLFCRIEYGQISRITRRLGTEVVLQHPALNAAVGSDDSEPEPDPFLDKERSAVRQLREHRVFGSGATADIEIDFRTFDVAKIGRGYRRYADAAEHEASVQHEIAYCGQALESPEKPGITAGEKIRMSVCYHV
jgi:hypothetical protein